ncbi:alpha/beta hydrolase [Candidatus Woesearchaeota archaeon]|nr:alpha/beta hydrolase [Candidatus Woesearchaeota archaeon]
MQTKYQVLNIPGSKIVKVKKIDVQGKSINYACAGTGKPLLLLHGWTNNWMGWIPLSLFLKNKYSVYMPDLPGFGDSDTLDDYSIEIQAEYMKRLIDKLGIVPEAVIGLSMGSLISAHLGKKYPNCSKKIILIGPLFRTEKNRRKKAIVKKILNMSKGRENFGDIVKHIVNTKIYGYTTAKLINMYKFDRKIIDEYGYVGRIKMDKKAYLNMGVSVFDFDLENELENYRLPLLLIFGSHDKVNTKEEAESILRTKNVRCSFSVIQKAGHSVSMEKPEEVAEAICSFL